MITIQLNGRNEQVPEGLTLAALVEHLNLPADRVAVEHNLEVVPRARWQQVAIQPGDRLEVVQLVGGGMGTSDTRAYRLDGEPLSSTLG